MITLKWFVSEFKIRSNLAFCRLPEDSLEFCNLLLTDPHILFYRLSACKAFKMCVDDFDFKTEQFLPFVNVYFNTLYKLLCDAKECDTKVRIE
jgi:hypothetical protein